MRGAPTAILIATLMAGGLAGGGMMMMRTGMPRAPRTASTR